MRCEVIGFIIGKVSFRGLRHAIINKTNRASIVNNITGALWCSGRNVAVTAKLARTGSPGMSARNRAKHRL